MFAAEKEDLIRLTKNDKKFHYMLTDRYRQDVEYFLRIKAKKSAKEAIERVSFLLHLFDKKDIPEWYTMQDLTADKKKFEQLF